MYPYIVNPQKLDLGHMDCEFVEMLNSFGRSMDTQIVANVGASRTGHSLTSRHYQRPCQAADFHVPGVYLPTLIEKLYNFSWLGKKFTGIGIYPFWNSPGFHADWRDLPVYWYRDSGGKYHYSSDFEVTKAQVLDIIDDRNSKVSDFLCDAEH